MNIVGQISSPQEAKEIQQMAKAFLIGNRARLLARQSLKKSKKVKK